MTGKCTGPSEPKSSFEEMRKIRKRAKSSVFDSLDEFTGGRELHPVKGLFATPRLKTYFQWGQKILRIRIRDSFSAIFSRFSVWPNSQPFVWLYRHLGVRPYNQPCNFGWDKWPHVFEIYKPSYTSLRIESWRGAKADWLWLSQKPTPGPNHLHQERWTDLTISEGSE